MVPGEQYRRTAAPIIDAAVPKLGNVVLPADYQQGGESRSHRRIALHSQSEKLVIAPGYQLVPFSKEPALYILAGAFGAEAPEPPHERARYDAAGVIAGGAARPVLELAGIKDIRTKSFGTNNKINTVKATIEGLKQLRSAEQVAQMRGKTVEEILG